MAWQIVAIWFIAGVSVSAFIIDELRQRAARGTFGRIAAPMTSLDSFVETAVSSPSSAAARRLDAGDVVFADRLRRARLRSVGF